MDPDAIQDLTADSAEPKPLSPAEVLARVEALTMETLAAIKLKDEEHKAELGKLQAEIERLRTAMPQPDHLRLFVRFLEEFWVWPDDGRLIEQKSGPPTRAEDVLKNTLRGWADAIEAALRIEVQSADADDTEETEGKRT